MNLHEFQAKELLGRFGVPVPVGRAATDWRQAREIAEGLGGDGWMVKAQVHAGGRGKAGGVKRANSPAEVESLAGEMLGSRIVTKQTTAKGQPVSTVLIEATSEIAQEFYLSLLVDRAKCRIAIIASDAGGMDIEEVAAAEPHRIITEFIDPAAGLQPFQARRIAFALGLDADHRKQFADLLGRLSKAFVANDLETGFGLVQALQPISATTMTLGESANSKVGDRVIIAAHGSLGSNEIIAARIVAKREFAGYWEYLLEEAFFTAPAHTNWGGAAMVDLEGNLLGIGSLMVHTVSPDGEESGANMIVPIDPVKASIEDIKRLGVPDRIPRPWLGFIVQKTESDDLIVAGLYDDCPAAAAGLEIGDIIIDVAGKSVESLAELFRAIWNLGPAGCEVPLGIVRNGDLHRITLISIDRNARLKKSRVH
eukprot:XP_019861551.1 PREDICTED: uncharacterized protein LOC109590029 [Amphimedon queenslandica]